MGNSVTKALIIREPWIDLILAGRKTWEIRSSNTNVRGKVGLIKSKSGFILGTVDIVNSIPLSYEDFVSDEAISKHLIAEPRKSVYLLRNKLFAWELANPRLLTEPIPYQHPQGAIIWVNLEKQGIVLV